VSDPEDWSNDSADDKFSFKLHLMEQLIYITKIFHNITVFFYCISNEMQAWCRRDFFQKHLKIEMLYSILLLLLNVHV